MARRSYLSDDEETKGLEAADDTETPGDETLDSDDFFDQEIDYGEIAEIEKALQTPPGHYVSSPPFSYREKVAEVRVLSMVGGVEEYKTIRRRVYSFWDKLTNQDTGDEHFLGLSFSVPAVYSLGSGEDRQLYDRDINGAKPDFGSQNWMKATKLYQEVNKERAKKERDVIHWLANSQLILTNKEGRKREGEDVARTFVVGFKLA